MMGKYITKPVEVEAFQITQEVIDKAFEKAGATYALSINIGQLTYFRNRIEFSLGMSWMRAFIGDWIINNEIIRTNDQFEAEYSPKPAAKAK